MMAFLRMLTPALCLLLTACSLQAHWQALREVVSDARQRVAGLHEDEARAQDHAAERQRREQAQDVGKPWLAGPAHALAREAALPAPLRARVDTTLIYAGRAGLPAIAERLQRATGIAVRVQPESLLPAELFLPRLSEAAELAVPALTLAELQEGPKPLADILDGLAARLMVWWRYQDGAIEFYRSETRAFDLRMLPLASQTQAQLGRQSVNGEGFDNAIGASMSLGPVSPALVLRDQVQGFLTRSGLLTMSEEGSSLVVTDTPVALERVAAHIAQENARAGRRVRLLFEEVTLLMHDKAEGAIDWRLLYAGARAAVRGMVLPGAAATSLDVAAVSGPAAGSRALIDALAQFGAVHHRRSIPLLTLNRRPVTYAVHSTFSYVDQVQSLGTRDNSKELAGVSVNQRRETIGTFLTLLPDAQDDGSILLSIGYDNTVAQPLKALAFGADDKPLQVQQLTLDGNGSVQQVRVRPGHPVVLSGLDRSRDSYDRQRLTRNAPMLAGGRDQTQQERLLTVIILSAQLEEADG